MGSRREGWMVTSWWAARECIWESGVRLCDMLLILKSSHCQVQCCWGSLLDCVILFQKSPTTNIALNAGVYQQDNMLEVPVGYSTILHRVLRNFCNVICSSRREALWQMWYHGYKAGSTLHHNYPSIVCQWPQSPAKCQRRNFVIPLPSLE